MGGLQSERINALCNSWHSTMCQSSSPFSFWVEGPDCWVQYFHSLTRQDFNKKKKKKRPHPAASPKTWALTHFPAIQCDRPAYPTQLEGGSLDRARKLESSNAQTEWVHTRWRVTLLSATNKSMLVLHNDTLQCPVSPGNDCQIHRTILKIFQRFID